MDNSNNSSNNNNSINSLDNQYNINNCNNNNSSIVIIKNINSIKQYSDWDCGVACISSILKWLNKRYEYRIINEIINTKSIWSIDLSNALSQLNVPHIYYTNSIGVRNDYIEKKYYKDNWESDTLRVNQLFFKSLNKSPCNLVLIASEKQLTIKQFTDHINKGFPIILLVDSTFLYCNKCKPKIHKNSNNDNNNSNNNNNNSNNNDNSTNNNNANIDINSGDYLNSGKNNNQSDDTNSINSLDNGNENYFSGDEDDTFFGHYIVLVGFSYETNEIIYIDPSSTQSFCSISFDDLDNARVKPGTDLDCIFITAQH